LGSEPTSVTDEVNIFQKRVIVTKGHDDLERFKKRVNLDAGKFIFGNRVCDNWNRLSVVSVKSVNKFNGILDNYLRDNRGF